jgi:hypothetical protein
MAQTIARHLKKLTNEFTVELLATMVTIVSQIREPIHTAVTRCKLVTILVVMVTVLAHWIDMTVMETIETDMKVTANNLEDLEATHNIRWVESAGNSSISLMPEDIIKSTTVASATTA